MIFYTLDNYLNQKDTIDTFESAIWTKRYYGDGDFEFLFPISLDILSKLMPGTLVISDDYAEIMVVDTIDIEDSMKIVGTSLIQWLNNRILRAIDNATVTEGPTSISANLYGMVPGEMLQYIVQNTCIGGKWLDGAPATGPGIIPFAHRQRFKLPNLVLGDSDPTGPSINMNIPYGPVYDQLKNLAETYGVGMEIHFSNNQAVFRTYRGSNRTSLQVVTPVVSFSAGTDTFLNSKEIQSSKNYKNIAYAFAPNYPWNATQPQPGNRPDPVFSEESPSLSGFELRAMMILDTSLTSNFGAPEPANYTSYLQSEANGALLDNSKASAIDGEVPLDSPFQYGRDYSLGDILEVQGKTGLVNFAQVTEFIRSQDKTGERSYPTLAILG
jgi:hypothetical protein